jgi:hypothetical protein
MNEKECGALMELLLRDETTVFCVIPGPLHCNAPKITQLPEFQTGPYDEQPPTNRLS